MLNEDSISFLLEQKEAYLLADICKELNLTYHNKSTNDLRLFNCTVYVDSLYQVFTIGYMVSQKKLSFNTKIINSQS